MPSPLSEKAYQKRVRELSIILQSAQAASSSEEVAGYWSLGASSMQVVDV